MVRKGFWCGLAFVSGLVLANLFTVSLWWVFSVSAAILAAVGAFAFTKLRRYFIVCGAFVVIGLCYSACYTYLVYDDIIGADKSTVTVSGYVSDYRYIGHGQGYLTVKCKVKGHSTEISFLVNDDDYEYYDNVTVTGKVSRIKDNYNFQSEKYYFSQGVFLIGEGAAHAEFTNGNSHPLLRNIRKYSDSIFNTVIEFSGDEEKGFLAAMLCGDKSEMEPTLKNMLYRCGIGHIFAVSGTHLVIFCTVLSKLLKKPIRSGRIRSIIMLILTWAFVVFSGMSVSVMRSAIMMSIVFASQLTSRRSDSANSLGIAAILLCIAQPYCVYSASFIMSFTAAFSAGVIAPYIIRRYGLDSSPKAVRMFVYSAVVSLCIAPVSLLMFGGYSVISALLNVLLIPFCTAALFLCIIVAFTGGAVFIAKPLLFAATWLIKPVIFAVKTVSELSLLYITANAFWAALTVILVSIGIVIYASVIRKWRFGAAAAALGSACCLLCSLISTLTAYGRCEMYIFANKNSCTAVLCESDNAIVFDIGSNGKFISAAERVLDKQGIRSTDAVFVDREPYYTIGRYKNSLYPKPDVYFSASEIVIDDPDAYYLTNKSSADLGDIKVTRLENSFEISYNDNRYELYPDCFYINDEKYDTDGVSVMFSSDENIVRRLDYELTVAGIAW